MLFAVHALDAAGADRAPHIAAHAAHLKRAAEFGVALAIGGPLVDDTGTVPLGSLMVFEAGNAKAVRDFHAADPYVVHRIWGSVHIARFERRT